MRTHKCRYTLIASLLFFSSLSYGQSSEGGSNFFLYTLVAIVVLLLLWAILHLVDNLMQAEAKKQGANTEKQSFSLFPSISSIFAPRPPAYVKGESYTALTKGHDIKLVGEAPEKSPDFLLPSRVAICPPDFRGIAPIPKMLVSKGDEVKAGDPIFFDKKDPDIKYVSPVSGEIVEIRRGAKRAITNVIILVDKDQTYKTHQIPDLASAGREEIVNFLGESGIWPYINKRPFDVVPARDEVPRDIFISTFDTAPLAIPQELFVEGNENAFQKGLDVLSMLTDGEVHLGLSANGKTAPHAAFTKANGVKKHYFRGKHPSGNVGVQIHHIAPLKPTDVVWTLKVEDVVTIGELFTSGRFKGETILGLVGSEFTSPALVKTYKGANIGELVKEKLNKDNKVRIISGDVLTGKTVTADDFLTAHADMVTAIKEGDYYEPFGWLLPIKPRPSISGTFPNFLFPHHKFEGDTNSHGEKRAFVVTGQYEEVMPMNIYPQHIMKAIMTNDFEKMEGLGLAELSEEDVALCEFACTSKMPLQSILRQGLDMMRDQM